MTSVSPDTPHRSFLWRARRRVRTQLLADIAAWVYVATITLLLLLGVERGFAWYVLALPVLALPVGSICAALTLGIGERTAQRGPRQAFAIAMIGWTLAALILATVTTRLTDAPFWGIAFALTVGRIGGLAFLPALLCDFARQGVVLDPTPVCMVPRRD